MTVLVAGLGRGTHGSVHYRRALITTEPGQSTPAGNGGWSSSRAQPRAWRAARRWWFRSRRRAGARRCDGSTYPSTNGYHAAKAAQWALTNSVRLELAEQGTLVSALHLGAVDTDFSAAYDGPKGDPADAVRAGLDGITLR